MMVQIQRERWIGCATLIKAEQVLRYRKKEIFVLGKPELENRRVSLE